MQYTVTQLAKKFGLSRSTLLYYDKIGLLCARARSKGNYRMYSEKECRRLEQVCTLRGSGLQIEAIKKMLDAPPTRSAAALRKRLDAINTEINALRQQQKLIVKLLNREDLLSRTRVMTKEKWIEMLRAAGLDDAGMNRWHREFEKSSPQAHQDFLESLGLSSGEIRRIRALSAPHKTTDSIPADDVSDKYTRL